MHRDESIKEHLLPLFRFAWALTGDDSRATDLTQLVFQDEAWTRSSHDDQHACEVLLFSAAYRRYTKGARLEIPPPHDRISSITEMSLQHADRLTADALLHSFRELELPQRAALVLFYTTKCSLQEIATILERDREETAQMIGRAKAEWLHILHREERGGSLDSKGIAP